MQYRSATLVVVPEGCMSGDPAVLWCSLCIAPQALRIILDHDTSSDGLESLFTSTRASGRSLLLEADLMLQLEGPAV